VKQQNAVPPDKVQSGSFGRLFRVCVREDSQIEHSQISGGFQALDLRFKLKAQLGALVIRQPIRHLWKYGPIKKNRPRLPRKRLCGARFGEYFVQFSTDRVGVRPIFGGGPVFTEQVGLFVSLKKVGLSGRSHASRNFRCRIIWMMRDSSRKREVFGGLVPAPHRLDNQVLLLLFGFKPFGAN
jgi:hypothetical protein